MENASWTDLLKDCFGEILEEHNAGITKNVLGKLLGHANESFQTTWIELNTNLKLEGFSDGTKNQSNADRVSKNGLRIQCKFRSTATEKKGVSCRVPYNDEMKFNYVDLGMTRRATGSTAKVMQTSGLYVPRVEDCDVYVITLSKSPEITINPFDMDILALPAKAIEDPKRPGFVSEQVRYNQAHPYFGKAKEVLEQLEKEKMNGK
jgi:hypothetical protein